MEPFRCPMRVVDHPPLSKVANITKDSELPDVIDDKYHNIESVKMIAVVKVIEAAVSLSTPRNPYIENAKNAYFLSDNISEPGTKTFFLLHTVSKMDIDTCFVTDGEIFWVAIPTNPMLEGTPVIDGFAYKIVDCYWRFYREDADKILDTIKEYVEGL